MKYLIQNLIYNRCYTTAMFKHVPVSIVHAKTIKCIRMKNETMINKVKQMI